MLNPAAAWEFMKETSLVIAPRTVRVWRCMVFHVVLEEGLRRPRSTLAQIRIVDLYVANGLRAPRRETHWE